MYIEVYKNLLYFGPLRCIIKYIKTYNTDRSETCSFIIDITLHIKTEEGLDEGVQHKLQ